MFSDSILVKAKSTLDLVDAGVQHSFKLHASPLVGTSFGKCPQAWCNLNLFCINGCIWLHILGYACNAPCAKPYLWSAPDFSPQHGLSQHWFWWVQLIVDTQLECVDSYSSEPWLFGVLLDSDSAVT